MPAQPGAIKQAWYKWKSLRLPWRKKWLVGADLSGNTFWEFKDAINAGRMRRIVQYGRQGHYADVKISPQWHQWLRQVRPEAPTLQEQQYEVSRQAQMRQLAAAADERWAAQESFLDAPSKQQPAPAIGVKDPAGYMHGNQTEPTENEGVRSAVGDAGEVDASTEGRTKDDGRFKGRARDREANPWKQAPKGNPGDDWQPQSWSPGVSRR
ncbi:hypothetical protein E4T48_04640 [Aureobasidium sp. EXF-10727]|nr:hypothetical protein E4T48_04640 [Aureobasidium sp. EXF-10727]KAI4730903.1 hypothetical protein E4T49_01111 [Aureobasidium sp. EXF-10728]